MGAEVDMKRVVPELAALAAACAKPAADVPDAVMDLVIAFPGSLAQCRVDVSIRCPLAERYTRAAEVAGSGAEKAAEEKRERYGPQVPPFVFESHGRLGPSVIQVT